ncbi:MAG: 2OG-Fe dioxygenase family protein [Pseudonocardiaceae bacterium]
MMKTIKTLSSLSEIGFERYELADLLDVSETDQRFRELLVEFSDLPPDPYAAESLRYRRYGRGILTPWSRNFTWIPPMLNEWGEWISEYYQGDHNPEYSNASRKFSSITKATMDNPLLTEIIMFDFDQTWWPDHDSSSPLHVGVHLVKLSVQRDDQVAISSPNELHQDGEPYTFAHLIYRDNAVGGRNTIAPPRCAGMLPEELSPQLLLADFELTKPLESYGVSDAKVSHYVSPIRKGAAPGPGKRAVLLIDFTPMKPRI